jgi:hypothetical protein
MPTRSEYVLALHLWCNRQQMSEEWEETDYCYDFTLWLHYVHYTYLKFLKINNVKFYAIVLYLVTNFMHYVWIRDGSEYLNVRIFILTTKYSNTVFVFEYWGICWKCIKMHCCIKITGLAHNKICLYRPTTIYRAF